MKNTYPIKGNSRSKANLAVLAALGLMMPSMLFAQDDEKSEDGNDIEVIEVKGIKSSVISAQQVKMGSDKIMDGISADDIGALPDRSVTETLQRVAGVAIDRYMTQGDPEHFSVEGNGVIVRGLTQVRSELNGRSTFSANGGRTLSFNDVPPELLSAVNVYKSPTADQIEGGLGGTVDLETRLPFQEDGTKLAFNLSANYGDLIEETKPAYSALYSDTWETSAGKFGVLVDFAKSELSTRNDSMYLRPFFYRDDIQGHEGETVYVPRGADWRTMYFDRERTGAYAAIQYAPTKNQEFTLTYFSSEYDMQWSEDAIFVGNWPYGVQASLDSEFDANGVFQKGRLTQDGGIAMGSDVRASVQESKTEDLALRYRYFADEFNLEFSIQKVDSTSVGLDATVATEVTVPYIDVDLTGSLPTVDSDAEYLATPGNYAWNFIMDNQYDRQADMTAFDFDMEYFLQNKLFPAIKFGARYSKSESDNADTGYNWSALAPGWARWWALSANDEVARIPTEDQLHLNTFDNFFAGRVPSPANVYAPNASYALGYPNSFQQLQDMFEYTPGNEWMIWNKRDLADDQWNNSQTEKTTAAYAMVDYETELGGFPVTGNFGVRYVKTENTAHGHIQYPFISQFGDGAYEDLAAEHSYSNVLPSFNAKVELTDDLLLRLAVAKTMARPDFNSLRADLTLNANLTSAAEAARQAAIDAGETPPTPTADDYVLTLSSDYNPYLDPMEATQFDLSLEWYYEEGSSAYFALFAKDISGYQVTQTSQVEYGGFNYLATWPVSSAEAEMKGAELSINHFFTDLPAPFDGLGVQANYTYIDSSTVAEDTAQPFDTDGSTFGVMPYRGLSEHSYNLVAIYEKNDISIRLAYNWRDEYLTSTNANGFSGTENDIYYGLPLYNAATGYLDGSIQYRLTDSISLVLEANNLGDTITKNTMVQNGPGKHYGAYHINDVRYALSVRGHFSM